MKWTTVIITITAVLLLFVTFRRLRHAPFSLPVIPDKSTLTYQTSKNPFGVMFADEAKVRSAVTLGAAYYRPNSVFVEPWNGTCSECDAARNAGLRLIITVRNNGGRQNPTTPPKDLLAFKKTLGQIIDRYQPEILVIENEENSEALFYAGTPADYLTELTAGCEVAHGKGIACTNGGLVSSLVALLVADSYRRDGNAAKANEFIQRTLGPKLSDYGSASLDTVFKLPKAVKQLERAQALLSGYKNAGADYVNFHWYIADTKALTEAVQFLRKATGLAPLSNEVGQQKNEDPQQVTAIMEKIIELKLPVAVWFSVDVPGYGQARSLINDDGSLRANGEAFKSVTGKISASE